MSLLHFESGADIIFAMSWDVWKHGHPPIELYGTEGSLRVPDPNFFGGAVQYTEQGGDWIRSQPTTGRSASRTGARRIGPITCRTRRIIVASGIAELASAVLRGTPHRSSGALASHALEVMHAILKAGVEGGEIAMRSRVERPAPLSDVDAMALWGEETF